MIRLSSPASLVPESLPLGWEVTVTSGDAEEESIILHFRHEISFLSNRISELMLTKLIGVGQNLNRLVLWWGVHLGQNLGT